MNERTFHADQAHRLDDPERARWLPPDDVIARLGVSPGMRIADIGAGTGFFAFPMARAVGEKGKVYAVDLQREMLAKLDAKRQHAPEAAVIENREGEASGTTLPDQAVDVVFLANVWHELDDHAAALREAARILRPGGRIAILDWRPDLSPPPGPPSEHRITAQQVIRTLVLHGWNTGYPDTIGEYSYLVLGTPPQHRERE